MPTTQSATDRANIQPKIFFSYSHADAEKVLQVANILKSAGMEIWLDNKDLKAGQDLVRHISEAISRVDCYVIFLSRKSIKSKWVKHELSTAMHLELDRERPKVLPVLLESVDLPVELASRLHIDASSSLEAAGQKLRDTIGSIPGLSRLEREDQAEGVLFRIASARFTLYGDTRRHYGGPGPVEYTLDELTTEAKQMLAELHRKAHGILWNFVPVGNIDFSNPRFPFPNGHITEKVSEIGGSFQGSISMRATVNVDIVGPSEEKLAKLVSSQLDALGVLAVRYQFALTTPITDLPQRVLEKLQNRYSITGWDSESGAEVSLGSDVSATVHATAETITVGFSTRYPFQMEKGAKEFAVRPFVEWLIEEPDRMADGSNRR